MKWLVVLLAIAGAVAGYSYIHNRPAGMRTDAAIDVGKAPQSTPAERKAFKIRVGEQPMLVTVTPDADYTAGGLVMSLNQPMGGVDVVPGTVVMVWGKDAEKLLDPKTKISDIGPDQGMVAVAAVTDDLNLQRAVNRLKPGQRVQVKGWRAAVADGSRVIMQSQELNGIHVDVVYVTELQIDQTLYAPSSLPPSE